MAGASEPDGKLAQLTMSNVCCGVFPEMIAGYPDDFLPGKVISEKFYFCDPDGMISQITMDGCPDQYESILSMIFQYPVC